MTRGAFTVATWNIEQRNSPEHVLEYLRGAKWDIACLQEARDRTVEALRADAGWQTVDWRQVMPADEKLGEHPHGAAILARNGWSIEHPRLLPNDAFAGRGVIAQLVRGDRGITVLSWHSAHGAAKDRRETDEDGRKRKMRGYEALGASLKELTGPVVLGFDANHHNTRTELTPADPPGSADPFVEQHRFFSVSAEHRLSDTLLTYLARDPERHKELLTQRPKGPLEITYRRGETDDRFDYLMVTEEFDVLHARVDWDDRAKTGPAGSDHGFVTASLMLAT